MGIEFDHVTKRFADGTLAVDDLTLSVCEGEFMIFVGPSGCGKTTALRLVAGLEKVTSGEIRIDGHSVSDLEPSERDVAMVFQNYALYPHMSVYDNLAFPLRMRRLARREIKRRVSETASLLDLEALFVRKPRELSGGQRQRVAMGRAIIRHPKTFLMDEPLSNLDARLRIQMRAELVKLHRRLGVTTLYVTHDQTEAMTLGQRVAVLDKGVVQQVDTPEVLYKYPQNLFVASFIGSPTMNLLKGRLGDGLVMVGDHQLTLPEVLRRSLAGEVGDVIVGLRPEQFREADRLGKDGDPVVSGVVDVTENLGAETYAYVRVSGFEPAGLGERLAELSETIVVRLDPYVRRPPGQQVTLALDLSGLHVFAATTGESLLLPQMHNLAGAATNVEPGARSSARQ